MFRLMCTAPASWAAFAAETSASLPCPTSCTTSGGWEQGWIVLAGTTVIRREQSAASGYLLSSTTNSLTFQPSGFGSTQATITVCRSSPTGSQERVVTVSATGRTTVAKTSAGSCS